MHRPSDKAERWLLFWFWPCISRSTSVHVSLASDAPPRCRTTYARCIACLADSIPLLQIKPSVAANVSTTTRTNLIETAYCGLDQLNDIQIHSKRCNWSDTSASLGTVSELEKRCPVSSSLSSGEHQFSEGYMSSRMLQLPSYEFQLGVQSIPVLMVKSVSIA